MRTKLFSVCAVLLLASAAAWADDETPPAQNDSVKTAAPAAGEFGTLNQVDFGLRGTYLVSPVT